MGGTSWIGQSRSTFRNGKCGKRTRGSEPTTGRLAWTASRLRTSRLICRTTSTSSGIGCRRAATLPPPVRRVDIPKGETGGTRPLGYSHGRRPHRPDGGQTTVLEPLVEPMFHDDSYGYRPGKSALDAVGVARQRCWRYDWVLDLDIKSFFDQYRFRICLMRAVRKHTDCPWVLLYIETMAESARADAGWEPRRAGKRNATGRGRQPAPGKSLSALRVRHLDAAEPSGHPVRALCRRCDLSLSQ